jgi:hypothetical protein
MENCPDNFLDSAGESREMHFFKKPDRRHLPRPLLFSIDLL